MLSPSDWTVDTILSQLTTDRFDLDPEFQRRSAWTGPRKSKFVESLMVGLPIPQLVFAEQDPDDPKYIVIDGKQRLLSLSAFFDRENPLRLTGLSVLPQLNGLTRSEIEDDPAYGKFVRRLRNRTIRTVIIRSWPNDDFLHLVFHRLNHQTLSLSAQELRQALTPGPFMTFADAFAADSSAINGLLGVEKPDFRMRDVELLVRYFALKNRVTEYRGNLKRFLDESCALFNAQWAEREGEFKALARSCEDAIQATIQIFGEHAFRRFDSTRHDWESRFNRAVFDVMTYYFSDSHVAMAAAARSPDVLDAYIDLSSSDQKFADALRVTTKTTEATGWRLEAWGNRLRGLGIAVSVARYEAPAIVLD
ncbi:MAG TPA: DUF262 domain-containing protein [Mycobacteriales bacterium]|nr:DUF262 domain-containing protein [Mycobacteriales bacterium]